MNGLGFSRASLTTSETDSFSFSSPLNFLSNEINTVSLLSIKPAVLYTATVRDRADLRLCPFNSISSNNFSASSLRNRTAFTFPFRAITYSTPGLISIVTVPTSIFPIAKGVITPTHNARTTHAANAAIRCTILFRFNRISLFADAIVFLQMRPQSSFRQSDRLR